MELDPVIVEVVEDGETDLVALPVVGLCPALPSSMGPGHGAVSSARGPGDAPPTHLPSSPVEPLPLPGHQARELSLLAGAVDTQSSHPV